MQQHLRILSILFYIGGAITLIAALIVLLLGGASTAAILSQGSAEDAAGATMMGGCAGFMALFVAILALPMLLAGWGLSRRKSWARMLTIVLAVLNLPGFPIGTALGVYALWVMFNDETKALLSA